MFYGFLYLHTWKSFRIIRLFKKKLRIFMISHQTTNCIIYIIIINFFTSTRINIRNIAHEDFLHHKTENLSSTNPLLPSSPQLTPNNSHGIPIKSKPILSRPTSSARFTPSFVKRRDKSLFDQINQSILLFSFHEW